jgi:regulator of sigma E protease
MNNLLFYVMAFALLLGVLVIVHEFGHYAVARLVGVKVLRFSVGFGRPLLLWRMGKDDTEWAISVFPLGGYVKMLGESDDDVAPHEAHRSFSGQSVWKRMAIVVAGPVSNLALAILVSWGLFMHGQDELRPFLGQPLAASAAEMAGIENGERALKADGEVVETWADLRWILLRKSVEQDSIELELINERNEISFRRLALTAAQNPEPGEDPIRLLGLRLFRPVIPAVLGNISPGSAAEAAGLLPGDVLLSIDGKPVTSWHDVVQTVQDSLDTPLFFEYQRGGKILSVEITPKIIRRDGRQIGQIGVMVADSGLDRDNLLITVRYDPWQAFGKALEDTWEKSLFTLQGMGRLVTGALSWRHISGPVTIADYAGQSAKMGPVHYLRFMVLVSISLAVLNLLPIPVLDGGHLLYYVAEIVRGRPLSEQCLEIGQKIGLALILILMFFALYNDFTRLISG